MMIIEIKKDQTTITSTRITINEVGLINLLRENKLISDTVDPNSVVVRIYTEHGDYRDISNDYPIIVFFDEKETKEIK